jgi:hypothetical protein
MVFKRSWEGEEVRCQYWSNLGASSGGVGSDTKTADLDG